MKRLGYLNEQIREVSLKLFDVTQDITDLATAFRDVGQPGTEAVLRNFAARLMFIKELSEDTSHTATRIDDALSVEMSDRSKSGVS